LAAKSGAAMTNLYLKEGISVIVEKAFTKEEFLVSFLKLIKINSKRFIYQIEVPFKIGFFRVNEREKLKGYKGIPKNKLKEKVTRNHYQYNNSKYNKARIFDSSKLTPRQIVNRIFEDIK
jgi:hypothetical protein